MVASVGEGISRVMEDLRSTWEEFVRLLGAYSDAASSLNGPCPPETLRRVENALGFELPGSLAANSPESYFEVFSVNRQDQRIRLLWTCYDPLMPPDWQLSRFERGRDLTEFVRGQILLYE